jgi:hypothetical protein
MAKQKSNADQQPHGYKSRAVREALAQNPRMKVREIVSKLAGQGIEVSANHVYLIKSKRRAKHRRHQRQQAEQAGRNAGMANPVTLVLKVRQLSVEAGGMKHLKQLIDVLSE